MKHFFLLAVLLFSLCTNAQSITDTWHGTIDIPGSPLSFVIHIYEEDGILKSKGDSPDQKAYGFPLKETQFENNTLKISAPNMQMSYEGTLISEKEIKGKFTQGGMTFPLDLKRGDAAKKVINRPQEPKVPFPYQEKEIEFTNKKDNVTLSGTLTLPNNSGKFPAVILISGSGPQDRNEEIFDHKPFWVIADYLTKNGYAVLRYDDRGYGKSTGNFSGSTTFDFAEDTKAAVTFLKDHKNIDSKKIGLAGHSEGGLIAQIVASEDPAIAFIISLAGPGIPGDELMVLQNDAIAKVYNLPEVTRNMNKKLNQQTYDILKRDTSKEVAQKELKAFFITSGISNNLTEENLQQQLEFSTSNWYRTFMRFDPKPYLNKINAKVLALNGEKDTQVVAHENLEGINNGLAHNKNVTIISYPNLNHLFQTAETGNVDEYEKIEETFNEKVLNDILQWLDKNVK